MFYYCKVLVLSFQSKFSKIWDLLFRCPFLHSFTTESRLELNNRLFQLIKFWFIASSTSTNAEVVQFLKEYRNDSTVSRTNVEDICTNVVMACGNYNDCNSCNGLSNSVSKMQLLTSPVILLCLFNRTPSAAIALY